MRRHLSSMETAVSLEHSIFGCSVPLSRDLGDGLEKVQRNFCPRSLSPYCTRRNLDVFCQSIQGYELKLCGCSQGLFGPCSFQGINCGGLEYPGRNNARGGVASSPGPPSGEPAALRARHRGLPPRLGRERCRGFTFHGQPKPCLSATASCCKTSMATKSTSTKNPVKNCEPRDSFLAFSLLFRSSRLPRRLVETVRPLTPRLALVLVSPAQTPLRVDGAYCTIKVTTPEFVC